VTIADGGDAQALFSKKLKKFKELPLPSLNLRVHYDSRRYLNFVQLVFHYYFCSSYFENKN
jgi:hypothetical protein